jgi:hypothetical protein
VRDLEQISADAAEDAAISWYVAMRSSLLGSEDGPT